MTQYSQELYRIELVDSKEYKYKILLNFCRAPSPVYKMSGIKLASIVLVIAMIALAPATGKENYSK